MALLISPEAQLKLKSWILECFLEAVPQPGLKESLRTKLSQLPYMLNDHSMKLAAALRGLDPIFTDIPADRLIQACLDEGLVKRVEFTVKCFGNARSAYMGDAILTAFIAENSVKKKLSPQEHQAVRTRISQKNGLAAFYDRVFGNTSRLPLTWEVFLNDSPPTAHQKAEFVEAVIGELWLADGKVREMAHKLCAMILGIHETGK